MKEKTSAMLILLLFFQFADTSSAKRCLKSLELTESERYELSQLPDLKEPLNRELLSPSDLDVLWTTFFCYR